jgi:hypothetical protein
MIGYPSWIEDITKLDNYYSNVSPTFSNYDKKRDLKKYKKKNATIGN